MTQNTLFVARTTHSPLGCIEVQTGWGGLSKVLLFGKNPPFHAEDILPEGNDPAGLVLAQIMEYLEGKRREFEVTIDWNHMEPLLAVVLKRVLLIPYGEIITYDQIAKELEIPESGRAVRLVLGVNPIPIITPCHRVVDKHHKLTDYSAAEGIRAKKWLLELEGRKFVGQNMA
jgi:methylated-DNA-[protein]-cysteine S-methyltransferase